MIQLKILEKVDLPYRVSLLNDALITPHINTAEKFSIEKTEQWLLNIESDISRRDFVFIYKDQKVGMGGLTNISLHNQNCELYMYMDPDFQGKGLGYLAGRELCRFAFSDLNLKKVFLYTFSKNVRANKLYEKIGFKLEGLLRNHTFKDEGFQDRNIYGILKTEFN